MRSAARGGRSGGFCDGKAEEGTLTKIEEQHAGALPKRPLWFSPPGAAESAWWRRSLAGGFGSYRGPRLSTATLREAENEQKVL